MIAVRLPTASGGWQASDAIGDGRVIDIDLLRRARAAHARGDNVILSLKSEGLEPSSLQAAVEISYDLQAGSYTEAVFKNAETRERRERWGADLAQLIRYLGAASVCEAGVGEATTLKFVLDGLPREIEALGFDLSLSRLVQVRKFLGARAADCRLFCGDLCAIPLRDDAVDVVCTNHSLESNGGGEDFIVRELLRATRRYLVLIEPDYELGDAEQKHRMDMFGYVRGLPEALRNAGAKILEHRPWPHVSNPLNRPSLIVAEKPDSRRWNEPVGAPYASPFGGALEQRATCLVSPDDGLVFPVIEGIACLLPGQAVLGSRI